MNTIVLMYHDIYRDSTSESGFQNPTAIKYKVRADRFETQVAAIDKYLRERKLPANTIDFTFDDGGVSSLTIAAPILEKYGFRGKFYISTGYIGAEGFLNAKQIRELYNRGHIIGSHSHSHPERMSALTKSDINDEWRISQMILGEILGFAPEYASVPNGYSSKLVLKGMVDAGIVHIDTSATTTGVSHYGTAIVRGRYAVTSGMSANELTVIVSSPFRRFAKTLRWHCLSLAKALLGERYLKIRNYLIK